MIQMALRPRMGNPWVIGLHHCAQAHAYDNDDLLIFNDIGLHVADALSSMIMLKNLRESEKNLSRAQAVGQVGSWFLDVSANRLEWSAETYRIFGIPQQEPVDLETFVAAIHPDDRNFALNAWNEAMAGAPYDIEHRIVVRGLERWVRECARIERDSEGRPLTGVGTVQDVTERKKAELALRQYKVVIDTVNDGFWITDAVGNMLEANAAYAKMSGYSVDELVNMHVSQLEAIEQSMEEMRVHIEKVIARGHERFETRHRHKDGHEIDVEVSATFMPELQQFFVFIHDITKRKRAEQEVHTLAFYDALTGLPNRRLLNDRVKTAIAAGKRCGRYGAVMFLDLDNFKPLNDTYGHDVGDLLLVEVAQRLTRCVREADTVARFGGDEFVVVLGELDPGKGESARQAGIVAEKICAALAEPYALKHQREGSAETTIEHRCTSSIGVALFVNHEVSAEEILKYADMAMYQAKEAGRNRIHFHTA